MYLTFDDGYGSNYIKTVLDCLRKNNVQCTFFIIGKCLQAYPELWQQAIIDGNEICYHSMKHENLMTYTNQQILNDIATWNSTAKEILGDDYVIPKIARLPGGNGNQSQRVLKLFNNLNYNIIAWNADSYTGVIKNNKNNVFVINQQIADYVLNNANIGTIQLQHFNCYDAPAVSFYIQSLKNKYTLGKISDAIITFSSST